MPSLDDHTPRVCMHCGAELSGRADCWLCHSKSDDPQLHLDSSSARPAPIQFGLDSILLLMTFVAVICGVFAVAPGAAVIIAVLSLPALVRTAVLARRDRVAGQPMGWGTKALTFLATTSFVVVLLAAMGAAFYATCWVGFWGGAFAHELVDGNAGYDSIGTGLIVGSALGIIAAGFVMWWLIRRAVKTNYRVPAWTSWTGFGFALLGLALFWIIHSRDTEAASFVLSVSGIGLVFSLLGLGTPWRWSCAWGTGLGAGPVVVWFAIAIVDHNLHVLDSFAAPILATFLGLMIGGCLHLWVMGPRETK